MYILACIKKPQNQVQTKIKPKSLTASHGSVLISSLSSLDVSHSFFFFLFYQEKCLLSAFVEEINFDFVFFIDLSGFYFALRF